MLYRELAFTDNSLQLDYYTHAYLWSHVSISTAIYHHVGTYMSSVHYTPTVTFGANVSPTVRTAIPFAQHDDQSSDWTPSGAARDWWSLHNLVQSLPGSSV